jgi:hypothetical protein
VDCSGCVMRDNTVLIQYGSLSLSLCCSAQTSIRYHAKTQGPLALLKPPRATLHWCPWFPLLPSTYQVSQSLVCFGLRAIVREPHLASHPYSLDTAPIWKLSGWNTQPGKCKRKGSEPGYSLHEPYKRHCSPRRAGIYRAHSWSAQSHHCKV